MNDVLRRIRFTPMRDVMRGRLTGRLDLKRMIDDAALPKACADCVHTVVKRTRLWRMEKIDVAQELIAHFHDGVEAGTTAEELVTHFGDVHQSAKLIRRAKKRKRPLAWHMMRWCGWSCVALFVFYLGLAVMLFAGKPSIDVDYLAKLNVRAAVVPEDERAWPMYREAMLALGYDRNGQSVYSLFKEGSKPGDPRWEELAQLLRDKRAALEQLRRAADKSGLGYRVGFGIDEADRTVFGSNMGSIHDPPGPDDTLIGVVLPQLGLLRHAGRFLDADTRLAVIEQDGDRAYGNLIALLGISLRQMMVDTLSQLIGEDAGVFSDAQLQNIAHRLGAHRADSLVHFEGERYFFLDIVQHMYSKEGRMTDEGFRLLSRLSGGPEKPPGIVLAPAGILLLASRDEMVGIHKQHMDKLEQAMNVPMYEMPSAGADEFLRGLTKYQRMRLFLMRILLPALEAARTTHTRHQASIDGTLTAIAVELYRRKHGRWPEALEELVPRYLPDVPIDRINGESIRYRVQDGRPVIYRVGVDRDDNGGHVPRIVSRRIQYPRDVAQWLTDEQYLEQRDNLPDGDWVLWPVPPVQW